MAIETVGAALRQINRLFELRIGRTVVFIRLDRFADSAASIFYGYAFVDKINEALFGVRRGKSSAFDKPIFLWVFDSQWFNLLWGEIRTIPLRSIPYGECSG